MLVVDPLTRQSTLPKLTRPAGRATVSRLKQRVAFVAWLDDFGASGDWLAGVPPAKISHFAGEAAVLDADELVPPEYSIVSLTYAVTSRFDAVMVGLPGAAQDRLRDSSPAT